MELNNPIDLSRLLIQLENIGTLNYHRREKADCVEILEYLLNYFQENCSCDIFTFTEINIVTCFICNYNRQYDNVSNIIRINCFRHEEIIDLIDIISQEFGLKIKNCLNSHSSEHSNFTTHYITLLPTILIIHLDRNDSDGMILDKCTIPLFLKSTYFAKNIPEHEYKLSAIICCSGKDMEGHYVCYVECGKLWTRYDEDITIIDEINNNEVMESSTIICYELIL